MVSLRKLFMTAASLVLVAGVASAVDTIGCTNTSTDPTAVVRSEGLTELLNPITFHCAAGTEVAPFNAHDITGTVFNVQLYTSGGVLITSKVKPTLTVTGVTPVDGATPDASYPGTVTGTSVLWTPVLYAKQDTEFNITISGIYVDASSIPSVTAMGVTLLAVSTENTVGSSIFAPAGATPGVGTAPILILPNAAIAFKSLAVSAAPVAHFGTVDADGKLLTLTSCTTAGGFDPTKTPDLSGEAAATIANVTFQASLTQSLPVGQRVTFAISNVPAGVTLFVPNTIPGDTAAKLVIGYDANRANGYLFDATGSDASYTQIPASGIVVYQITGGGATATSKLVVPIIAQVDNPVAAAAPTSILAGYAPIGTATVAPLPRFVNPTSATANLIAVTPCTTTLFFPYVVVGGGYDTGLAVANAGSDPTDPTTALDGTCTFTFYGSGAPTTTTPLAVKAGQTNAFDLLTAYPTGNFSGYAVAQCTFQKGAGYAFVVNSKGSTASYLPSDATAR